MTLEILHTLRALSRQRLYAVMVLLIMGVGLGANAVLVAVADALFLQPLPYRDGERVALLDEFWKTGPGTELNGAVPAVPAFAAVAGYRSGDGTVGVAGEPLRVRMAAVTPSFFEVFRDQPLRGRTFASPGVSGAHGVVISEHLAGILDAGASSVVVDGLRRDVLGVMPAAFEFPGRADVWMPADDVGFGFYRGTIYLRGVARFKPDVGIAAARQALRAQATAGGRNVAEDALVPLRETLSTGLADKMRLAEWLSALILLVSWVAVLHSQVLRLAGRSAEFATRLALGARPRHLLALVGLESAALYGGGAALALGLAAIAGQFASQLLSDRVAHTIPVVVSWRTVLATAGLAAACSLLAGLVAIWRIRSLSVHASSGGGARTIESEAMAPGGLSLALVAAQVSLTTAAVVCTLLLWQSFHNVLRTEAGIDPSGIIAFRAEMPAGTDPRTNDVFQRIEDALRPEPGVEAVGSTSHLPLRDFGGFQIPVSGSESAASAGLPAYFRTVSPGYFATIGTRLVEGRAFTRADGVGFRQVVLNERLAQSLWPGQSALGRRIRMPFDKNDPWAEVVGVVASVRHFGLTAEAKPEIFVPARASVMTMVVKCGRPALTEARIRALVHGAAPGVLVFEYTRVEDVMSRSYRDRQLQSLLALACAVVSIAVASTTIFAVVGLLLRARARDVAIRLALGASSFDVLESMTRHAAMAAGGGLAGGLLLSWMAGRYLEALLYQLESRDPLSFAAAAILVTATAVVASLEAARRCTGEDTLARLR
ncbi:MAG: ABC transporter permease [Vicinamibacteraceae bacterium]